MKKKIAAATRGFNNYWVSIWIIVGIGKQKIKR